MQPKKVERDWEMAWAKLVQALLKKGCLKVRRKK